MTHLRYRTIARTGLLAVTAAALILISYGTHAYARDGETPMQTSQVTQTSPTAGEESASVSAMNATNASEIENTINTRLAQTRERLQQTREQVKAALSATRLKVCEARQHGITTRMGEMVTTSTSHVTIFSDVATQVEAFVTTKHLTVANYASLVADVAAKQAAAEDALATAKASSTSFSCTDANPSLAGQQFKDAHAAVVTALENYRTAIKNLIVATKAAASATATTQGGAN